MRKIKKGLEKNHTDFKKSKAGESLDGLTGKPLKEPVPEYFGYPGDAALTAKTFGGINNNSWIIFGRDRWPLESGDPKEIFSSDVLERKTESGYSTHMAAGAIDIVVGRDAPYPSERPVGPIYTSVEDGSSPSGVAMDAARIYVSQMTRVDAYFKIKKPLKKARMHKPTSPLNMVLDIPEIHPVLIDKDGDETRPRVGSAIVIKADDVRLHARRDIKIVTRGEEEQIDSQGNIMTDIAAGIHLIAHNGKLPGGEDLPQHPMVLGANLESALYELSDIVEAVMTLVINLVKSQAIFNNEVKSHFHVSGTGPTMYDIKTLWAGIISQLATLSTVELQKDLADMNLAYFKSKYLSGTNSERPIISSYNTTN